MALSGEVYEDPGVAKENVEVSKFLTAIRRMPGAYGIKVHGDMFCKGEPDTIGVYCGLPFAFEWKKGPREPLREIQKAKLKRWEQGGAFTGVYWRATDALESLADYARAKLGIDKAVNPSI